LETDFSTLNGEILNCKSCELFKTRQNAVVGGGVLGAKIMLIGEAPGASEDEKGVPFIGKSGELLMKMLAEIGVTRDKNLYITNTVKCRPPNNRNPKTAETTACKNFLERQILAHNPKIIILVGNFACKYFLGKTVGISKIHGDFFEFGDRILFPVYHPAAILRNPNLKPVAKMDFKKLKSKLIELKILEGEV